MDIYKPYQKESKAHFLIEQARKRNRRMSEIDHQNGFAAPEDRSSNESLRTVIGALVAGVELWDNPKAALECITEGIALLQHIEAQIRTTEGKA
jgi:hypothetical protein